MAQYTLETLDCLTNEHVSSRVIDTFNACILSLDADVPYIRATGPLCYRNYPSCIDPREMKKVDR